MIKLIVFDLGQVLVTFDVMIAIKRLAPYSDLDPVTMKYKIFGKPLGIDLEYGAISPETFFDRLCNILKFKKPIQLSFNEFVVMFNEIFTLNQSSVSLLQSLSLSVSIGILSNTNILHYEYLKKTYPVLWEPVTYEIMSFACGMRKPDVRIYRYMLNQTPLHPQEVLMIDDKQENVDGALCAGFDAVRFFDIESLKQELLKRDIRFKV